jgi:hypothetical protein
LLRAIVGTETDFPTSEVRAVSEFYRSSVIMMMAALVFATGVFVILFS